MRKSRLGVTVVIALLAVAAGVYALYDLGPPTNSPRCNSNYVGNEPIRSRLANTSSGSVPITSFSLPLPSRAPNGLAVALDGSVWFGEESLPALAHLYLNGTLLEYVWPGVYPPPGVIDYSCGYRTQIWGVALWNGTVWATDTAGNQLVSLDPRTGSFHSFLLSSPDAFPDSLVAGLDGGLWFTEHFAPAIARLDANGSLHEYSLPTGIGAAPTQVYFVNSTYAIYCDAGEAGEYNSGLFRFSPSNPVFTRIGGTKPLSSVTSMAPTPLGVWISEHGPPNLQYFDYSSGSWSSYPTSSVSYSRTTLPYFLVSDGSNVWFNEHFGDRIAEIDTTHQSMVEYAISSPPATNLSAISGAQTIVRDGASIWFTEFGSNGVGLARFSNPPPFSLITTPGQNVTLARGTTTILPFKLQGASSSPLHMQFSDSETLTSVPSNLTASSSVGNFSSLGGAVTFNIALRASDRLLTGNYIFDVTVTDGSTSYTVFLRVVVR